MGPGRGEDDLPAGRAGHGRGEKDAVAGLVVGEDHPAHPARGGGETVKG